MAELLGQMDYPQIGINSSGSTFKNSLTDSIIYALSNGQLSIDQKRGIITLLSNKNKNRLYLKKLEAY